MSEQHKECRYADVKAGEIWVCDVELLVPELTKRPKYIKLRNGESMSEYGNVIPVDHDCMVFVIGTSDLMSKGKS